MYSERDAGPSLHSVGVNAIGFFDLPPVPLEKEVNVHRLPGCGIVFVYSVCHLQIQQSLPDMWQEHALSAHLH